MGTSSTVVCAITGATTRWAFSRLTTSTPPTAATAIFTVGPDRRITSVNEELCRITGYGRAELLGKSCGILCDEGARGCPLGQSGEDSLPVRSQCRIHHRDGGLLTILKNARTFQDGQNRTAMIIESFVDVTELVRAREELRVLNIGLEAIVQQRTLEVQDLLAQKDSFIRQLGHDLQTPLTPLVALLPMIAKELGSSRLREMVHVSIDNVSYIRQLVERTLRLARISASEMGLDIQSVDLLTLTRNATASLAHGLGDKQIVVVNEIVTPLEVWADPLHLREVMDNVLTNAVKYMGGPGTISISARRVGESVRVEIADTGIGMTAEQTARATQEFYKADESRHDRSSIGLGLSICQRIVQAHGGSLRIESPGLGHGSVVSFTLRPIDQPRAAPHETVG